MTKLILTTLVLSAAALSAQAGSISLDARTDYEATNYNDAAKTATKSSNYNRFNLQTLRLDAKGHFDEVTNYRLRFRFTEGPSAATKNSRDSVNKSIDFAWIGRKLTDQLTLQMGKFGTDVGGAEGTTSGPDLYFQSLAYQNQNEFRYATGAKLLFTFNDQEINLMATNQQSDAVNADNKYNQTQLATGLVYKGAFLDKKLLPILSWHSERVQPTTATGIVVKENNYYAAGLKYDFAPFFLELDYLFDNFKSRTTADQTDKASTAVATIGGKMDNWVTKLKVEDSTTETISAVGAEAIKAKNNSYQLALEYTPTGDKNFRYHIAYVHRSTKPATGDAQTIQNTYAGFRIYADFLK
jgi:hypothetical protein